MLLAVSALSLTVTVVDRSLRRIGAPPDDDITTETEPQDSHR
ncbi:hypothetical protein ACIO8F_34070 [Streptomyces sp. NPDC087228]